MHKESKAVIKEMILPLIQLTKILIDDLNELTSTVVCFYNLYRAVLMHYS